MSRLTKAQSTERRIKAARMRIDGSSWEDIARALDLRTVDSARRIVRAAVEHGHVRACDLPPTADARPREDRARAARKTPRNTGPARLLPLDWRSSASCRDEDPELFFSSGGWSSPGDRARLAAARRVCSGCPVATPCLIDAIAQGDAWSVRAGTTPDDRRNYQVRSA